MVFEDKLAELRGRYLLRTGEELTLLRQTLPGVQAGDAVAVSELRNLAHRICGSSAMLGFKSLSELSGQIEAITRQPALAAADAARIAALLQQLQHQLQLDVSAGQP
jgi:HPt (histidine-containing phosphotransfer) domain-containing protein